MLILNGLFSVQSIFLIFKKSDFYKIYIYNMLQFSDFSCKNGYPTFAKSHNNLNIY